MILKTRSNYDYHLWYFDILQPLNHVKDNWETATHIEVAHDFSDLYDILTWCTENESKCAKIAENSKNFYEIHLSKSGILDYLEKHCEQDIS